MELKCMSVADRSEKRFSTSTRSRAAICRANLLDARRRIQKEPFLSSCFFLMDWGLSWVEQSWKDCFLSSENRLVVFFSRLPATLAINQAMGVWALASLAWAMDLLDTTIFSCSMFCGIVILLARNFQLIGVLVGFCWRSIWDLGWKASTACFEMLLVCNDGPFCSEDLSENSTNSELQFLFWCHFGILLKWTGSWVVYSRVVVLDSCLIGLPALWGTRIPHTPCLKRCGFSAVLLVKLTQQCGHFVSKMHCQAALCLVAGQVFARQAQGLNTTDKVRCFCCQCVVFSFHVTPAVFCRFCSYGR